MITFHANTPQELKDQLVKHLAKIGIQYSADARIASTATGRKLLQAKADAYEHVAREVANCEIKTNTNLD